MVFRLYCVPGSNVDSMIDLTEFLSNLFLHDGKSSTKEAEDNTESE